MVHGYFLVIGLTAIGTQPQRSGQDGTPAKQRVITATVNGIPVYKADVNRELSLLAFNQRVLAQAKDPATPLLERLRFLCISCSNLDEFFEVRVAGLIQQESFGAAQTAADGLLPSEALKQVSAIAHDLVADQYTTLNDILLPALADEGIRFLRRGL